MIRFFCAIKCFFVGHVWVGDVAWMCDRCLAFKFNMPKRAKMQKEYQEAVQNIATLIGKYWLELQRHKIGEIKKRPRS